jgi:phosphinothricin acetyltransferase
VTVESRVPWFEAHPPGRRPIWVVELDGRIAGWLSLSTFYGRPAYDKTVEVSVYVHESFRRRGLGSYFLSQALAHAPSIGVETLLGFVFAHNLGSLALFEHFGFERWGELPQVAELDGVPRHVVILGRRVP